MPGFSVDEGCTAAFQGSQRFGVIDFTHKSASGGEWGKFREILIFNPVLHANSIVLVTPHTAARSLTWYPTWSGGTALLEASGGSSTCT